MKQQLLFSLLLILVSSLSIVGQNKNKEKARGQFSGDLQLNTRVYQADSARGAIGNPFYDSQFYGAEAWLQLNYRIAGFDMGLRFDMYQNTPIFNPTVPFSAQGIGRWYISKTIKKFNITAGYLYDQFGSGSIFRAYEARALGIDQAMFGIGLSYDITENWQIRGFTARQKNRLELYRPLIKGLSINGYTALGKQQKISLVPGLSFTNRTIDRETMDNIVLEINGYALENRFFPKYNTYLFSAYNTLNVGRFSWYTEVSVKTEDVIRNQDGLLFNPDYGTVLYNTLTYSQKGFGAVLQFKYTKNFDFRAFPNTDPIQGVSNYIAPLARQNSYRLLSRYNAATQTLGELAFQLDITYKPKRSLLFTANYADLRNLDGEQLFREIYIDALIKPRKKAWKTTVGIQLIDYNQAFYEQKGDFVHTLTPFVEFVYKVRKKQSLRAEVQFMLTKRNYRLFGKEDPNPDKPQDLGDWLWGLLEYNIAPKWSFALGSMYNFDQKLAYPLLFTAYTLDRSRFSLTYTKQPEGIVCTGGVCRFEPAFSGLQFGVTTSF